MRDWSLITAKGGGGYKMEKSMARNFVRPPPQDRVKLSVPPPLLKSRKCPIFSMAKTFSAPPPFVGVKLHTAPLPFCSPPFL